MGVLSTPSKGVVGVKAAKTAVKHPGSVPTAVRATRPVGKLGLKTAKPLVKRRARPKVDWFGEAARSVGETLLTYGLPAFELAVVEPPKPKRTAPRVAAGAVLGAAAVYFLEPEHGREHRDKVAQLVS